MSTLLLLASHTHDLYSVLFDEKEKTLELKNTFRLAESCACSSALLARLSSSLLCIDLFLLSLGALGIERHPYAALTPIRLVKADH